MHTLLSRLQIKMPCTSSMRPLCEFVRVIKLQFSQICTELLVQKTMEVLVFVWSIPPRIMLPTFTMSMEITLRLSIS